MAEPLAEELEYARKLEERAHRLRMVMLSDPEFMAGIERGLEDERQGRLLTLDEFERALDLD
jgi:predicted transcriptional regulator